MHKMVHVLSLVVRGLHPRYSRETSNENLENQSDLVNVRQTGPMVSVFPRVHRRISIQNQTTVVPNGVLVALVRR